MSPTGITCNRYWRLFNIMVAVGSSRCDRRGVDVNVTLTQDVTHWQSLLIGPQIN